MNLFLDNILDCQDVLEFLTEHKYLDHRVREPRGHYCPGIGDGYAVELFIGIVQTNLADCWILLVQVDFMTQLLVDFLS